MFEEDFFGSLSLLYLGIMEKVVSEEEKEMNIDIIHLNEWSLWSHSYKVRNHKHLENSMFL